MKSGSLSVYLDDLGNRWIIEKSDPGWAAVEASKKLRMKNAALPVEVLLGRPCDPPNWESLVEAIMKEESITDVAMLYVANSVRAELRGQWTA